MSFPTGSPKPNIALLVGTRKGAFVVSSDAARKHWSLSEVHCRGGDVYHFVQDARNGGAVYAAVNYTIWGAELHVSHNMGGSWTSAKTPPKFADREGKTLNRIWHIKPGGESEPGVLYAGADPASLFRSDDRGMNWQEIRSIADHPTSEHWFPGMGGLCLHSIALDERSPARMWVGISAAGVYGTDDGGESWKPLNKGVRADFIPDERDLEFGQCPHKLLSHPARDGLLYQQNHVVLTAATMVERAGLTSRKGCRRASGLLLACTRMIRIRCTCCRKTTPSRREKWAGSSA